MVFLVLNAIICGVLVAFSFAVDTDRESKNVTGLLINLILFLAALFGFMAGTIGLCYFAPKQLVLLFGKTLYVLMAWFSTASCFYLLGFPECDRSRVSRVVQWTLNAIAVYIIFCVPGAFTGISITPENSFHITSSLVFSGPLGRILMLTWLELYTYIYMFFIPLFIVLMVFVRADNVKSPVVRQKILLASTGVITSWVVFAFVNYACRFQPMFLTLYMLGFVTEMVSYLYAVRANEIWDRKIVLRTIMKFFLNYFLPAVLLGLFFTLSWPLFSRSRIGFIALFSIQSGVLLAIWYLGGQYLMKKGIIRDRRYADAFTNEITGINFDLEPKEITRAMFDIFHNYVDSSSMQILIDSGDGYFNTLFDSRSEEEGSSISTIEMNAECFDRLLNIKRHVVFREFAEKDYSVLQIKESLLEFFDATNSDAFILLSEGHHIFGVIVLGRKESGNPYNSYDFSVFNELYSSFFVLGYYMKNIMNESVVGTVNREVKMSAQIITSLQENMDRMKNPKIDAGYLMVPARTIGGEFVDMIRLTDSRYIFIIGALSGKGIAASMSMVIMKSIIRTYLAETADFKKLVDKVNRFIRECLPRGTFFAGTFGLVDFSTDTMYYINCGSAVLFLYTRAYNNVIEIQGEGRILGFAKDVSSLLKVKKVKLSPGDIVFSCTDGLIESRSLRGEKYGKARLQNEIMENSSYPAARMSQFIHESLVKFSSKELEDDVTMFMLKYLTPEDTAEGTR